MTEQHDDHARHDHGDHDDHDHGHLLSGGDGEHEHVHTFDWRAELESLRDTTKHFYEHQFDWKGHGPPPGFTGPRYFPPSDDWRFLARLDKSSRGVGDKVTLATSTGQLREMEVVGDLVFEATGSAHRLTSFLTHGSGGYDVLFVPFRDGTSGVETYGAGRYVEVPYEADEDEFELDFNFAYNPTCAFSPAYDCPYPPASNRLDVEVRAGEMVPFDKPAD